MLATGALWSREWRPPIFLFKRVLSSRLHLYFTSHSLNINTFLSENKNSRLNFTCVKFRREKIEIGNPLSISSQRAVQYSLKSKYNRQYPQKSISACG